MPTSFKSVFALGLVVAGLLLILLARDKHFFWFEGGALGVVLVVVGLFDSVQALRAKDRSGR